MRQQISLLAALTVLVLPALSLEDHGLTHSHSRAHAEPISSAANPAFPLDAAQAELHLAETREYMLAVGARLETLFNETYFPKWKRLEGMTQPEFEAAAKELMVELSKDPLYTAGVSSRPGAMKPSFDWPWTRNYPITDQHYVHIGWRRMNRTEWEASASHMSFGTREWIDRRPHILGEWKDNVPADCATDFLVKRSWFDPEFEFADPDGFEVYVCGGAPPRGTALPALPKTRRRLTLCVHDALFIESLTTRMRSEWLPAFLKHYTALGVEHFYIYVSRIPFIDVPGYSYDWIDVTWMHAFKHLINGQLWAADDCLLRNREQGNVWTLLVDVDELIKLPGVPGGLQEVVSRLEEQRYESASFHSVAYLPGWCDAADEGERAGLAGNGGGGGGGRRERRRKDLAERMVLRAVFPEQCADIWQQNCSFNNRIALGGRRKILVKVESTPTVEVHSLTFFKQEEEERFLTTRAGVKRGDFNPMMRAMNASRVWIKHIRGAAFEDVTAPEGKRLLCSGLPASCLPIPGGFNCSKRKDLGEAGRVLPNRLWYDERPYELRARAMGDAFAGSYETVNSGGTL